MNWKNNIMLMHERQPEVFQNILETIGHTPLVRLNRVINDRIAANIYAKVEFFNPAGSIKDRIGLSIIEAAENEGRLLPGGTIVEATSGQHRRRSGAGRHNQRIPVRIRHAR